MAEQLVAVPLLEPAHSSADALTLRGKATIGGITCHVIFPGLHPDWAMTGERDLEPPYEHRQERTPNWLVTDWGFIHAHESVTIRAVGLILFQSLGWGDQVIEFDHAVGQWRHLLRDWLSVVPRHFG